MTALELYRFVVENKLEYNRFENDNGEVEVLLFIEFYNLKYFAEMLGPGAFDDEGIPCTMKDGYVCVEMSLVCDWFDIDIDEVFKEEQTA